MMHSQTSLRRGPAAKANRASDIDIDTQNTTAAPTNGSMNPTADPAEDFTIINTTALPTPSLSASTSTILSTGNICDLGPLCGNTQVLRHIRKPREGIFCAPCRRNLLSHLRDAAAQTNTPLSYGEKLEIAMAHANDVASLAKMGAECAFDISRDIGVTLCIAAVDRQKKMMRETVLPVTKQAAGVCVRNAGVCLRAGVGMLGSGLSGLLEARGKKKKKGEGRYQLAEGVEEDDADGEEDGEGEEGGGGFGDEWRGYEGGEDSDDEVEWQLVENPRGRSARNGAEV
ncbi:hypothetical protein B0T19DRAFT_109097 [Cercophora scortea]|uniref:Uncharacterized protein n=1 Tax=Cercophora scortea TaxID=314031 RepID=A0AAE0IXE1_9PEZI|nr:hypothetical protein B0T19DRAFT_109097 [Cercophora scortea]